MRRKGLLIAGILALLFVPGTIPAALAVKSSKLKRKYSLQNK